MQDGRAKIFYTLQQQSYSSDVYSCCSIAVSITSDRGHIAGGLFTHTLLTDGYHSTWSAVCGRVGGSCHSVDSGDGVGSDMGVIMLTCCWHRGDYTSSNTITSNHTRLPPFLIDVCNGQQSISWNVPQTRECVEALTLYDERPNHATTTVLCCTHTQSE